MSASSSSSCEQKHAHAYLFVVADSYWHLSFYPAIQFHPVERMARRSMPHSKRLTNVEEIPFPTSKHFQSKVKFNSPPS